MTKKRNYFLELGIFMLLSLVFIPLFANNVNADQGIVCGDFSSEWDCLLSYPICEWNYQINSCVEVPTTMCTPGVDPGCTCDAYYNEQLCSTKYPNCMWNDFYAKCVLNSSIKNMVECHEDKDSDGYVNGTVKFSMRSETQGDYAKCALNCAQADIWQMPDLCLNTPVCKIQPPQSCTGIVGCFAFNTQSACENPSLNSVCEWTTPGGNCQGTVNCASYSSNLTKCRNSGCDIDPVCTGVYSNRLCAQYTSGCSVYLQCNQIKSNCDYFGCTASVQCVNMDSQNPANCAGFQNSTTCAGVSGCSWVTAGVCKPTLGATCGDLSVGNCGSVQGCYWSGSCVNNVSALYYQRNRSALSTPIVDHGVDCNDTNPNVRPGAVDIYCNGIDENCDGADNCTIPGVNCTGFNLANKFFEIQNSAGAAIARVDSYGTMWIKGTKQTSWVEPGTHDFVVQNNAGTTQFWIQQSTGNLYAKSSVLQNISSSWTPTSSGNFVIQDSSGIAKAWITSTGTVNLKGCLGENKTFV